MERSLVSQGADSTGFRNARAADWQNLCMQEALHHSGTDLIKPDDLNDIVQREIAAGRLDESSFSELATHAAKVMGEGQHSQPSEKGFLRRLFG